ncbi:mechanosensitive ion channel family protein [Kallotenue papyrolyticum]|uniref:mechanosensitive ion channel family protein n=1 Tax=Kallotenue papyrolyticum TaxID=1325125 RepID=UPI0004706C94|nr:mechanosensitive ion channel domain-containing protein [Kallotenue papyrolyticum]
MNTVVQTLLAYIPRVLGALMIIVVGVILAVLARRTTAFALRRLRFDLVCERIGIARLLQAGGMQRTPSQFVATIVFYAMVIFAVLAALGPLGLDFLALALNQVLLYAPRLLAAVLILILGSSAAGLLAELADSTLAGVGVRRSAAVRSLVQVGVVYIAVILAAAVLGIDVTILIVITVIVLGGIALTAALALGLGLRELSRNIAASRYIGEGIVEGDEIVVSGYSGRVERIGYALTTLRASDGRIYLVPNGLFLSEVVQKQPRLPSDAFETRPVE